MSNTIITNDTEQRRKLYDAYEGAGGFETGGYLIPFPEESSDKYAFRQKTAMYDNAYKMILNANITPVFNNVIRENTDESELLEMFLDDCNGANTPLKNKIRNIGIEADNGGFGLLFFDSIKTTPYLKEAIAKKEIPKLIDIRADKIFTYILDVFGNIKEVTFYKNDDSERFTYKNDNKEIYPKGYFLNYSFDEEKEEFIEIGCSPAIAEPVLYSFGQIQGEYLPKSEHYSLLSQACAVYGFDSLIGYQGYMNTYKTRVIVGNVEMSKENASLGEDKVLMIPEGGNAFVLDSASAVAEIIEAKEKIKKNMFENYNLGILNTSADASGESREQADTLRLVELQRKAEIAELLEKIVVATYLELVGEKAEYKCEYPTTFRPSSISDAIDIATKALSLEIAPENKVRIKQRLMLQMFSSESKEVQMDIQNDEFKNDTSEYEDIDLDDKNKVDE